MTTIQFKRDGKSLALKVDEERMLPWVLRMNPALAGIKYGCGEGLCSVCTDVNCRFVLQILTF